MVLTGEPDLGVPPREGARGRVLHASALGPLHVVQLPVPLLRSSICSAFYRARLFDSSQKSRIRKSDLNRQTDVSPLCRRRQNGLLDQRCSCV
jgi:hypothetical protein